MAPALLSTRALFKHTLAFACILAVAACKEPPSQGTAQTGSAKPPEPAVTQAPAALRMPEVTLDSSHVQLGIEDLQLSVPSFDVALKNLIEKFPASQPDKVVMNVARNSKITIVNSVAYALFDAGAKLIEVRTKSRGTFPDKITLSPEKASANAPPCSYASLVRKNLSVCFWPIRGGTAKTYGKGMAGPDFTAMHEVMFKEAAACNSLAFFFSADDSVEWGHAFDLGTSTLGHDPPYKVTNFVLLREIPVAGKPVKIPQ